MKIEHAVKTVGNFIGDVYNILKKKKYHKSNGYSFLFKKLEKEKRVKVKQEQGTSKDQSRNHCKKTSENLKSKAGSLRTSGRLRQTYQKKEKTKSILRMREVAFCSEDITRIIRMLIIMVAQMKWTYLQKNTNYQSLLKDKYQETEVGGLHSGVHPE